MSKKMSKKMSNKKDILIIRLRQSRKVNNYSLGISIYHQIKNSTCTIIPETYDVILSLVNENFKDIPKSFLQEITQDILKLPKFHSENTYTLFIKFLALQENLDDSITYLSKLKEQRIKLKCRIISPIIEVGNKLNRIDILLPVIQDIFDNQIHIGDAELFNIFILSLNNQLYDVFDRTLKFMSKYINIIPEILLFPIKKRYHYLTNTDNLTISRNGKCPNCHTTLQSIDLNQNERVSLLNEINMNLVKNNSPKSQKFQNFIKWTQNNTKYDIVIDGANVGYFNQRPDLGGKLSFSQIDMVAQYFQKQQRNPIIFLHNRHLNNLNYQEDKIVNKWKKQNILYITPSKLNDDWYWLYYSICNKANKPKLLLITNDKMGDHHFKILSSHLFEIWKERTQVTYDFINNKPKFMFPSRYSIKIQLIIMSYHIPYYVNDNIKWLCIT